MAQDPLEIRHPLYQKNCQFWSFYEDHYEGGPSYPGKLNPVALVTGPATNLFREEGAFGTRLYLWQYPLETNKTYQHRLVRALPVNIVAPVIDLYCSTVGKQENVLIDDGGLQEFMDDADMQGQSFLEFLSGCRTHAATRGHTFILVDSTKASGPLNTNADVKAQRIRPYLVEILPENLLNWRLDETGQPTEILYQVEKEVQGNLLESREEDKPDKQLRYWNKAEWIVYRKDGNRHVEVDRGSNPLGRVPLIPLYHHRKHPFLGKSLIKDAAKIQQLLVNWASGFDEALEKQLFAQPVLYSNKEPSAVGVGISTCLHLNPDDKEDFKFTAPPTAPFEAGWDAFYRMVALANKHMGMKASAIMEKENATSPQSGVARAWDFYEADKIMSAMALNEQETAKNVLDLVAEWKGGSYRGNVQYSTKYDLSTVADDISDLLSMQMAGAPPTARREVMRRICAKKLPSLPQDVQKQIDAELKAFGIQPEPADTPEDKNQPGNGPGSGNQARDKAMVKQPTPAQLNLAAAKGEGEI